MSICEQELELFNRWAANRAGFVSDGVVSEPHYLKSPLRVCFVLKEVNDLGGGGWDLRQFIREGARKQTWNNISRWTKCISHIEHDFHWSELAKISNSDRIKILKSVCAMNLKKSPGGHTTEKASFNQVVGDDKNYIQEQYSLYAPDITICCGTGWDLHWALELENEAVRQTNRGINWFLNHNNKAVIMFSHPEARVQDSLLVYGLVDAVRDVIGSSYIYPPTVDD
ncbi:hypothetical protein L4D15_16990 [Enterovibrio norvegicus]|uniref:hypothetical protein n=1 Tax=Enterovibrio norvegicus TaxID=188144 RepID=UPI003D0BD499